MDAVYAAAPRRAAALDSDVSLEATLQGVPGGLGAGQSSSRELFATARVLPAVDSGGDGSGAAAHAAGAAPHEQPQPAAAVMVPAAAAAAAAPAAAVEQQH
jgi:hypothetical protein